MNASDVPRDRMREVFAVTKAVAKAAEQRMVEMQNHAAHVTMEAIGRVGPGTPSIHFTETACPDTRNAAGYCMYEKPIGSVRFYCMCCSHQIK